jgi:hypothetical protein
MTIRFIAPSLCAGLMLFAALMPTSASAASPPPPKTVDCSPTKVRILTSQAISTTTSTSYADVAEATLNFTQGGSSPTCVIVRFSAQASSKEDGVTVRPLLDVSTKALPPEVALAGMECIPTVGCTSRSYSFEFVFPRVAPGNHLLRMQYKAGLGSAFGVYIETHNTVVVYAP